MFFRLFLYKGGLSQPNTWELSSFRLLDTWTWARTYRVSLAAVAFRRLHHPVLCASITGFPVPTFARAATKETTSRHQGGAPHRRPDPFRTFVNIFVALSTFRLSSCSPAFVAAFRQCCGFLPARCHRPCVMCVTDPRPTRIQECAPPNGTGDAV